MAHTKVLSIVRCCCYLYRKVYIHFPNYNPIIVHSSRTIRKAIENSSLYTSNTNVQCLFSPSTNGYRCAGGAQKKREINDIDNNYRFVLRATSEKVQWGFCCTFCWCLYNHKNGNCNKRNVRTNDRTSGWTRRKHFRNQNIFINVMKKSCDSSRVHHRIRNSSRIYEPRVSFSINCTTYICTDLIIIKK